jgi:hypothetical protein
MNIRYTEEGTAIISVKAYLDKALADCGVHITKHANTPGKNLLFDIDPTSSPLDKEQAERFHSITAKLLYVSL